MPKTAPLKEIEEFERENDLGSLQYLDDNDHNWRRGCMKRAVFSHDRALRLIQDIPCFLFYDRIKKNHFRIFRPSSSD